MRKAAAGFALIVCGCNWGTRPIKYPPAQGPQGAIVAIRVDGESKDRIGELFTVDTIGVTILEQLSLNLRVTRIAWRRLHAMDVEKLGSRYDVLPLQAFATGGLPSDKRDRLAALSRFPGGLEGELLGKVLAHYGQQARIEVAQAPMDSVAVVAAQTAAQFADRSRAVAAGYRRIGGDFPGMGEHWVNPWRFGADSVDPHHPSFLTYATIRGVTRLLGVGFIATTVGAAAPTGLPGWPSLWHEHSGLLAEESAGARSTSRTDTHVWVLHVWTDLPNPAGRYSADNWALPFVRAGLTPPRDFPSEAGRALSLMVGGDEFLKGVLVDASPMDRKAAGLADSVIERARKRVVLIANATTDGVVSPGQVSELKAIWSQLAGSLDRRLGGSVTQVLSPVHSDKRRAPK